MDTRRRLTHNNRHQRIIDTKGPVTVSCTNILLLVHFVTLSVIDCRVAPLSSSLNAGSVCDFLTGKATLNRGSRATQGIV